METGRWRGRGVVGDNSVGFDPDFERQREVEWLCVDRVDVLLEKNCQWRG